MKAKRSCNINAALSHKTRILFRKLKNYDSHLIMQELGKFNFKINFILNGLEKYMIFNINNEFFGSFQFLSSSIIKLKTWVNDF